MAIAGNVRLTFPSPNHVEHLSSVAAGEVERTVDRGRVAKSFRESVGRVRRRFGFAVVKRLARRNPSRPGGERRGVLVGEVGFDGGGEELEDVARLLATGLDHPSHNPTALSETAKQ